MESYKVLTFVFCFICITFCDGVPHLDSHKRVVEKPLSDAEHYDNEVHNSEYDHEAFLGQEEARKFDQLSPEESKERLAIIVDKIDKDKDGFVTQEELKNWIKYTQTKYITDDVDRQWSDHNEEKKDTLSWDDYKKVTYSYVDENDDTEEDPDRKTYKEMMQRDKRRWTVADKDGDGHLTKEEFGYFLHPEEAEHMKDIVITETIEDIDKDGDGKISMQEYIGDMYNGDEDTEPDWVKNEKEQFSSYRDKDNDGFMDKGEVKQWILPDDYNHADTEAAHLIHESDGNKDGKLTKEEIISNYDIFVGSQATDFGEALTRHDEF